MAWVYEENPDRKHKRKWDQPIAGFVEERGETVAKCPATMTVEAAEKLLNSGIPYSPPRWPHAYPERISISINASSIGRLERSPGDRITDFPNIRRRLETYPKH